MAKINELRPIDATDKAAAIEALMNYKRQNPVKFEAKKAVLFAKYGLEESTPIDPVKDETDTVLETKLEEAKKTKKTK